MIFLYYCYILKKVYPGIPEGGITAQIGKYRIVSRISVHDDSTIWLAEHNILNVKRIIKGIRKTSPYHNRLVQEAHLLKKLKHPYIPEIFDLEEDSEFTYIVEQYIEGVSLKNLCNRRLLTEQELFLFFLQLCNILEYLHSFDEGILYLDLKPENILISGDTCFLVDFGSAKFQNDLSGPSFGTKRYASPEQLSGDILSKSSDIFSAGVLLGYMVDHSSISPKTEKMLRKLVYRCSEKKKWNRICSIKGLTAHINDIQKRKHRFSDRPIKISFAGIACNTGVTYLSLCFSGYLNSLGRKCAYAEVNDTEAWYALCGHLSHFKALAGLEVLSRKTFENDPDPDLDIIADYGCLNPDMPSGFYESDISCIVAGNRVWETDEIITARALSYKCRNRLFIINLTSHVDPETVNALNKEHFLAIPYITDFDKVLYDKEVKDVFMELAVMTGVIVP